MLRQQTSKPEGRPNRCLADYIAPSGDHLGGFAVTILGAEDLAAKFEEEKDDYKAIMVKASPTASPRRSPSTSTWRPAAPGSSPAPSPTWRTCTPNASAASARRSATRPAPTTASSRPSSTCWTPDASA